MTSHAKSAPVVVTFHGHLTGFYCQPVYGGWTACHSNANLYGEETFPTLMQAMDACRSHSGFDEFYA